MKLAVVGGRDFKDYEKMKIVLSDINITLIISGGARGADTLAIHFAKENNIAYREHLPDWETYGKRAGPLRNKRIVNDADMLVAFWDGKSKGTRNSIDLAVLSDKHHSTIRY